MHAQLGSHLHLLAQVTSFAEIGHGPSIAWLLARDPVLHDLVDGFQQIAPRVPFEQVRCSTAQLPTSWSMCMLAVSQHWCAEVQSIECFSTIASRLRAWLTMLGLCNLAGEGCVAAGS